MKLNPWLVFAVAAGCSAAPASGGFSLTIDDAKLDRAIGALSPATGNHFVDVGVTLTNNDETTPVPDGFLLYSMTSASAIVYPASVASANLVPSCQPVGVAKGGHVSCRVAFEMPSSEVPSQLDYADTAGSRDASAPIATIAPLPEDTCLSWTRPTNASCNTCNNAGPCANDVIYASTGPCSSACTADWLNGASTGCTMLPAGCQPSAGCQSAVDALNSCLATACDPACL